MVRHFVPGSMERVSESDAVRAALFHHPLVGRDFARIGMGSADMEQAGLLPNPDSARYVRFGSGRLVDFAFEAMQPVRIANVEFDRAAGKWLTFGSANSKE